MKTYTIFYAKKPILTVAVIAGDLTYSAAVDIVQHKRKELGEKRLKYIGDISFQHTTEQEEWEYICAVTRQRMSKSKTPVVIRPPEIEKLFRG